MAYTQVDVDRSKMVPAAVGRSWFTAKEIASIYGFPAVPTGPNAPRVVIGVVSFGGGLYGNVNSNGFLTGGDVQAYWTYLGITAANQPKVIIVPVDGGRNTPSTNDGGATYENTLDIQTIGGCFPSSRLTIILYLGNPYSTVATVFTAAKTSRMIGGVSYRPTIISCSWGLPEVNVPNSYLTDANTVMASATAAGITICTATGDNGSNNGVGGTGNYVDFPSSSPHATAVGGTRLVCPTNTYSSATETAWSYGGGGVSAFFTKPNYQSALPGETRSIPDIAAVADPNTGVLYFINGTHYVFGGTSVAAPVVAAFFAINNLTKFANPLLYASSSSCFNDITSGSNGGFSAKAGYDNCTGLGTMIGAALKPSLSGIKYRLSSISLPLYATPSYKLVVNPTPTVFPAPTLTWTSSAPGVATVDSSGVISVVSGGVPGSAIITCVASGNGSGSASFNIKTSAA